MVTSDSESCGIIRPPNVVSVSYGQDEVTISAKSAERQCAEYGKIGLLGTTVLYSSGDFGVAGFGNVCLDADGKSIFHHFFEILINHRFSSRY